MVKNTMSVCDIDELKRHGGSAFHGIFIAAGGAETAVATERNKPKLSTVRTAIHGTPKKMGHRNRSFYPRFQRQNHEGVMYKLILHNGL